MSYIMIKILRLPLLVGLVAIVGSLSIVSHGSAQDSKPADDTWYGVLDVGAAKLRLEFRLRKQEDGSWEGVMVSLDQAADTEFPFDSLTYTDKKFEWAIKRLAASYKGKISDDGATATGGFKQAGTKADLDLKKVDNAPQRKLVEVWQGNMSAGPQEFEFQFRVFEDSDGGKAVMLDSFTEQIMGLNCEMSKSGQAVTISVPATSAKFVGTLNDREDSIDGHWIQAGNEIPLSVKKVPLDKKRDLASERKRPQTPQGPFKYDSLDLEIENASGNSVLAGTLTIPKGDGPFPVTIMISGSGPQDRDETILGHKPFLVIADHLTNAGMAVFRYDDRGIGKSKGDFSMATSKDFADDVSAIVDFLKQQPKIDPAKISLAGHSEGGLIAPMVASERDDIAGIILLAGTGVTGQEISLNQSRKIAASMGAPPEALDIQENLLKRLYSRLSEGKDLDDEFIEKLLSEIEENIPEDQRESANVEALVTQARQQLSSPWFKFFALHDPAPVLQNVKCPVLALFGEKDLQVDPELNLPPMEAALKKGGNQDFEIKTLPGLNHLFQHSETGLPTEYAKIEETMAPELLQAMEQWLTKRMK